MATGRASSRQEVKTGRACRSLSHSSFHLPGVRWLDGQKSALCCGCYRGDLPHNCAAGLHSQTQAVLNCMLFQWRAALLCEFAFVVGASAQEVLAPPPLDFSAPALAPTVLGTATTTNQLEALPPVVPSANQAWL